MIVSHPPSNAATATAIDRMSIAFRINKGSDFSKDIVLHPELSNITYY
jgi:hypothetical protein